MMKKLNMDVNNRIYTVLDIWVNGTVEEVKVGNAVDSAVLPAFFVLKWSDLKTLTVKRVNNVREQMFLPV